MNPSGRQNAGIDGRVAARTEPMFNQVLPAHPRAVRKVLHDIRRRFSGEVSEDTLGRLELVLAEVMNNVAEHSRGPACDAGTVVGLSIHVSIVRHVSGLCCAITDNGISLPPDCLIPRNSPPPVRSALPEGGWGWYIIHDLTQALCYYREGQRNYLAFNLPFGDDVLRH